MIDYDMKKLRLCYHKTGASVKVTDGIIVRAATIVIVTTGGTLERTASPGKAILSILIDTAACRALLAAVVIITNSGWLHW